MKNEVMGMKWKFRVVGIEAFWGLQSVNIKKLEYSKFWNFEYFEFWNFEHSNNFKYKPSNSILYSSNLLKP